jgi:hypothetical protein
VFHEAPPTDGVETCRRRQDVVSLQHI